MKTSRTELELANNLVPKIGTKEGIEKHKEGMSVFIDVRDGLEIRETGTIREPIIFQEVLLNSLQTHRHHSTIRRLKRMLI